jgi:hypothetical protein
LSFKLVNYQFQGPFKSKDKLKEKAGVFAIFCGKNNEYIIIDVGHTDTIKSTIENHGRKRDWDKYCKGDLFYACLYKGEKEPKERESIENKIRLEYLPLLGAK